MTDRSFGLFEPDSVLPARFYATFRGSSTWRGPKRLMLAVLQDALDCYQKYAFSRDGYGRQLFDEANAWIQGTERDWHFSFENICEALDIDPGYVRRGIRGWRREAVAVTYQGASSFASSERAPCTQEPSA